MNDQGAGPDAGVRSRTRRESIPMAGLLARSAVAVVAGGAILALAGPSLAQGQPLRPANPQFHLQGPRGQVRLPPGLGDLKVFHYGTISPGPSSPAGSRLAQMAPRRAFETAVALNIPATRIVTASQPSVPGAWLESHGLNAFAAYPNGDTGWIELGKFGSIYLNVTGIAGKTYIIDLVLHIDPAYSGPPCQVGVSGPSDTAPTLYPCPTASGEEGWYQHLKFAYFADQTGEVRFTLDANNFEKSWGFYSATITSVP